jgi:hypothetical protein
VAAGFATVFEPGKNEWTADGLTKLVNVFEAGPALRSNCGTRWAGALTA